MPSPAFDSLFAENFGQLLAWRRDVRHFKPDPVAPELLDWLLAQAALAPSVGLSQPWRFVLVQDLGLRQAVLEDFERSRAEAEASIPVEKRGAYGRAKLEGLREAPLHLAAFTDTGTHQGHGLGVFSMPECLHYSTVMAVHTLWLAAQLRGLGVGWVSILQPQDMAQRLAVPAGWQLTAYLCLGYPAFASTRPELESTGWEQRRPAEGWLLRR
jgi:5,6-dimethylbenzimidazole synthase